MSSPHSGGFTLIEVLVAVLLLAIGIIGAAGTQVAAQRTRQSALYLSRAVQLASGLADRMRANRSQMAVPDAANPYLQLDYQASPGAAPAISSPCYDGNSCSSAQLAAFDLDEVRQTLHAGFPGGRIAVCRDTGVWDPAQDALTWQCRSAPHAPIVIKVGWHERLARDAHNKAPRVAIIVGEWP